MGKIARIIYVGPSLYGVSFSKLRGELWYPPAKQGDILDAVIKLSPRQIVLIDGEFHQSLAVWHKELLYALLDGVVLIGAASMGALRAAEMHPYGMIGIGEIFGMYLDGEEDDSLVAMTYDPVSMRPLREAAVSQETKRRDAIQAIEFARFCSYKVPCPLDKKAHAPYIQVVINRILPHG